MGLFYFLAEMMVVGFACWTLAYHFVLALRLPANVTLAPFALLLALAMFIFGPRWRQLVSHKPHRAAIGVAALGLVAGVFCLSVYRPDLDDFYFMHRMVVQLEHWREPFFTGDTHHNLADLPAQSATHVLTAYEPLLATIARLFNFDLLHTYYNLPPFVGGFFMVIAYTLLFRQFGSGHWEAAGATLVALGFLALDGELHRSFGNATLARMWQGKVIMWGVTLPLVVLFARRFLMRPAWRNWLLVCLGCVAAVGLSGSGLFMASLTVAAGGLAYLLSYGFARRRLLRVAWLATAVVYPAALIALLALGVMPDTQDTVRWGADFFPVDFVESLGLVFGLTRFVDWARLALILFALPLATLPRLHRRYVPALSVANLLLFANPLSAALVMRLVLPGAYWRLAYLFPLGWCAGLIAIGLRRVRWPVSGRALVGPGVALLTLVVVGLSARTIEYKSRSPNELNYYRDRVSFADEYASQLANQMVLADRRTASALGLAEGSIRFEVVEDKETWHIFRNAGLYEEADRRRAVGAALEDCTFADDAARAAFAVSLEQVDALVIHRECSQSFVDEVTALLDDSGLDWTYEGEVKGFPVFHRY